MADLRGLKPHNALLVIVDYQEKLLKIMDDEVSRETIANINLISQMFQHWNAPVVVTEQYPRGLGHTVAEIKNYLPRVTPIEKSAFSCCGEPAFIERLLQSGRRRVLLVGMETHICVLQTALDLVARDVEVFAAVDAIQSSSRLKWEWGLRLMEQNGIICAPTESLLYQMAERAGTDDFKQLVRLVKERG